MAKSNFYKMESCYIVTNVHVNEGEFGLKLSQGQNAQEKLSQKLVWSWKVSSSQIFVCEFASEK